MVEGFRVYGFRGSGFSATDVVANLVKLTLHWLFLHVHGGSHSP